MTTPAETVINAFGGSRTVMTICGLKHTNQVRRWSYPKERGGCDGLVPQRHHAALLKAAKERGIALTVVDLCPWVADA